ncbi:MAG: alpha/beta hydrolase [Oscillospiraceae bacterium]|nr:alpha/beta hydrolase [Oscillospiraceae bacterium]
MVFHTFGDKNNGAVVLIHGVLTPWQIWERQIEFFKEKYFVVVPALDGHIEEQASEYLSVDDEAEKIENYINKELGGSVFAVCGLSMGGVIANRLFERNNIKLRKLVLDGAPLVKISSLSNKVMTVSYKSIIHKSKNRDAKTLESFKRDFLPERFLTSYLKFADTMSDSTIENMIRSVSETTPLPRENPDNTEIMFLHGTKGNEVYSKKAAKMLKQFYPELVIRCFDGFKHAELAIYQPDKWLDTVDPFLTK